MEPKTSDPAAATAAVGPRPAARAADRLALELAAAGARFAFGVPGGEVLTLLDALERAGIRFVVARHENAAGFMAEGAARLGGGPGVLLATIGPGVANAVNVCANALQDGVPLVILGGRVALDEDPAFTHQVIDQAALFRPVAKRVFEFRAEGAAATAREIVACALAEPRGPVYVDCPTDEVLALAIDAEGRNLERDAAPSASRAPEPVVAAGGGERSELAELASRIAAAARPLLLVGMDALRPGVPDALTRLATRAGCSVVTTYRAKGLIDEDDPHALGAAGLSPLADEVLLAHARRADLVLLVGYDPVEMRSNWTRPIGPDQEVHALGPNRRDRISERYQPSSDLATDLARLADLVSRPVDPEATIERAALREELARRFAPRRDWEPAALLAEAAVVARRRGAVTTVDTGAHRILLAQQWRLPAPDLLLQSTGFCTMACALPLAIGARLAAPERPVLAVVGDGGLEMGLGELATLRDLGGPLVVVVLDDSSYALIDMKQRSRGLPAAGVHLGATDFAAVARAFGGRARRVEDRETFREALEEGFDAPVFTLLHAPFPRGAYDGRI